MHGKMKKVEEVYLQVSTECSPKIHGARTQVIQDLVHDTDTVLAMLK